MDMKLCLFVSLMTTVHFGSADEGRVTVKEGEHAILKCSLSGNFKVVIWKKADSPMPLTVGENVFTRDKRVAIVRKGNEWTLIIQNSVMSDGGEYECRATMDGVAVKKSYFLDVQSVPVIGTEKTENVQSNVTIQGGETALLSCSIKDSSLYHIIWKKASTSTVISVGYHVFIRDDRFSLHVDIPNWDLMIKNARPSDDGTYICLATDDKRSVTKVFNLEVIPGEDDVTTPAIPSTSPSRDDSDSGSENEAQSSDEVNDKLLKATQLQFYREEILTDQKKRELMDIEKDFFEVAKRYFESKEEEGGTE